MPGEVRVERRDALALVTIANPAKRNALDPAICAALAAALRGLGDGGERAAVLTGDGDKAFSAGFDVAALPAPGSADTGAEASFDALIDALAACRVPVVAALNGAAHGGGCELAATCDLRVAHARVSLGMPPARLGLVYRTRGLARFAAICGESRARQLFLAARTIDGAEAHAWGLVDHLVEPADVVPRALALAGEIAALAPLAVQGMRRGFEALLAARRLEPEVERVMDATRRQAWESEDAAEALRAFTDKRRPVFTGR